MTGIETSTKVEWLLNMPSTLTSISVTSQGAPVVSQCTHCAVWCSTSSEIETDKRTLASGLAGDSGAKPRDEAEAGGL